MRRTNPAHPERIELIDPLAQDLDGAPLAAILADPAVQVVVHAGRQDVALVRRRFATEVRNVFDTQVAAGFAGLGAQSSYDTLLAEILDVRVAKSASFTRWDTRPLSPEQRVRARGRRAPARAGGGAGTPPGRARPPGVGARGVPVLERRQRRARPGHGVRAPAPDPRLEPLLADDRARARGVARAHGRHADRPVQSILGDAALVEIAKRKPSSTQPARADPRHQRGAACTAGARELLDAVRRGRERPPEPAAARSHAPRRRTPTTGR